MGRRLLGAVLLLAGGAVHTRLAFDKYGSEELIAVFFLNGLASAVFAVAITLSTHPFAPVAGIGVAAVSLAAFALSRVGDGVLGFRGHGLDPAPEALLTLLFESAALAVLASVVLDRRQELVATDRQAAGR